MAWFEYSKNLPQHSEAGHKHRQMKEFKRTVAIEPPLTMFASDSQHKDTVNWLRRQFLTSLGTHLDELRLELKAGSDHLLEQIKEVLKVQQLKSR